MTAWVCLGTKEKTISYLTHSIIAGLTTRWFSGTEDSKKILIWCSTIQHVLHLLLGLLLALIVVIGAPSLWLNKVGCHGLSLHRVGIELRTLHILRGKCIVTLTSGLIITNKGSIDSILRLFWFYYLQGAYFFKERVGWEFLELYLSLWC